MTSPQPCRWIASDQPRGVIGEHYDDCVGEGCRGCWPCLHGHCLICRREHNTTAEPQVCASCVGTVREDIELIVDMHDRLQGEAINAGARGDGDDEERILGGDAMVMLAMPYRDQNGQGGAHIGDDDRSHESPADPVPPLLTLATWEDAYRDHLGHEQAGSATIGDAAGYLDRQLSHIAQVADVPFEDFARDVRQCRGRLEDVLHDGVRVESGAPCPKCGRSLVREWGKTEAFDRWKCPSRDCGTWYLDSEYRRFVSDDYRANSDRLTAPDMAAQYGVSQGSVRGWASLGKVRKRGKDSSGRQLYDVGDVLAARDGSAA